jgi:acyl-CoA dehydrogenase
MRGYTEEHEMFRASVKAFLARELTPFVEKWEEDHKPDRDFWRKAGALGILGAAIPERYGGPGGDFLYHAVVAEELGSCIGGASVGPSLQLDLPAFYILGFGTDEQKSRLLPQIVSGDTLLTVAMTEPHTGSDLSAIRTTATKTADGYLLNGSKTYISGGLIADVIIVVAKTDIKAGAKGLSLFLVDRHLPGVAISSPLKKMGMQASDNVEIYFDGVQLDEATRLGEEGQGFSILMSELARERLLMTVRAFAEAELAFALTVAFVKDRIAFGKRVIEFQNTQFTLATLKADLAVGKAFVDRCVAQAASGELGGTDSAIAKLWVTEMQGRLVDQCVQLHGGSGYMAEYPICSLYTAARVTRIYSGTSEIMRMLIARSI